MDAPRPADLRVRSRPFTALGAACALLLAVPLLFQTVTITLVTLLAPALVQDQVFIGLLALVSTYGAGLLAFGLVLRRSPPAMAEEAPHRQPLGPLALGRVFLIALAALYCANLFTVLCLNVVGLLRGQPVSNPVDTMVALPRWLSVLLLCVAAPLCEEWMFRGMALRRLAPYGDKFAILASALLFSLFHGTFSQYLYSFAVGCVFAWVALRTRCLWQTILLHCAINLVGSFLPQLVQGSEIAMAAFSFAILAVIALGAVLLASKWRSLTFRPGAMGLSPALTWRLFFENPGMALFFLISLFMAVSTLVLL